MARVRLLLELPDLSDPDAAGPAVVDRLLAEVHRAALNGEGMHLLTAGAQFTVEALAAQLLGPTDGLILNAVSVTDLDQALHDLRALAGEALPELDADDPDTLRRVLAGVEAVYLIEQRRFADPGEQDHVLAGLRDLLPH